MKKVWRKKKKKKRKRLQISSLSLKVAPFAKKQTNKQTNKNLINIKCLCGLFLRFE